MGERKLLPYTEEPNLGVGEAVKETEKMRDLGVMAHISSQRA